MTFADIPAGSAVFVDADTLCITSLLIQCFEPHVNS